MELLHVPDLSPIDNIPGMVSMADTAIDSLNFDFAHSGSAHLVNLTVRLQDRKAPRLSAVSCQIKAESPIVASRSSTVHLVFWHPAAISFGSTVTLADG